MQANKIVNNEWLFFVNIQNGDTKKPTLFIYLFCNFINALVFSFPQDVKVYFADKSSLSVKICSTN